jgi:hypothetical protein
MVITRGRKISKFSFIKASSLLFINTIFYKTHISLHNMLVPPEPSVEETVHNNHINIHLLT